MRSTRTTGGGSAAGVVILISALALGLSGCSGSGQKAAKPGGGSGSGPGAVPTATGGAVGTTPSGEPTSASPSFLTDAATTFVAPEFRHPAAWSAPLAMAAAPFTGFGGMAAGDGVETSRPGVPTDDGTLMRTQARFGMVAVAGNEVVVPQFGALGSGSPTASPMTVQFLDAKTGQTIASHPLPDAQQYYGMEPVTVGGKTDVEVRYAPSATAAANGQFTSVLLDPTGAQVWSSAGQPIAGPLSETGSTGPTGLIGQPGTGLVHDGGYVERVDDPSPSDRTLANASIAVLDLTGKTVLSVPRSSFHNAATPNKFLANNVQVAGGYAIVTTVVLPPAPADGSAPDPGAVVPERFTVYDLAHHAKKTADITEPVGAAATAPASGWGAVLATCGSKLLLEWPNMPFRSTPAGTTANLAVLDAATGHATSPPITLASSMTSDLQTTLRATTDSSCSAALVSGTVGVVRPALFAVDWTRGQALWQQVGTYPPTPGPQKLFLPLTVHGGVAWGLRSVGGVLSAAAIGVADGQVRETGFALSPIGFTAGNAPVFLQIDPAAPPPYTYTVTTTSSGATAGQTTVRTSTPPPPPLPPAPTVVPTTTQSVPGSVPQTASASGTVSNQQYAMTVWAGSS